MSRFAAACLAVATTSGVVAVHGDHGGYVHRKVKVEVSGDGETNLLSDGLLEVKAVDDKYDYDYEYLGAASEDYNYDDYGLGVETTKPTLPEGPPTEAAGEGGGGANDGGSYQPKSVLDAWNNHFDGFGGKDIAKIMLDYTDASVLKAFDFTTKELKTAKGTKEIEEFFVKLLCTMNIDTSAVELPLASGAAGLLEMKAVDDEYDYDYEYLGAASEDYDDYGLGTASYEYNYDDYGLGVDAPSEDPLKPVAAKGEGEANKTSGAKEGGGANGAGEVKGNKTNNGAEVTENGAEVTENPRQVYLIWACPTSGIVSATDTFIFNPEFKITRQNIVYTSDPNKTTPSADKKKCPN